VLIVVLVLAAFKLTSSPQEMQPTALTLQQGDVGQDFRLMVNAQSGPTQKALIAPSYQKQFIGGNLKYYMNVNVFEQSSLDEINNWAKAHSVPVTYPPTIEGSYVVDHHGIFAITSQVLLYADEKSAIADFHCCTYVGRQDSFSGYRDISVQIGNEATAFGGILDSPAHAPAYEPQLYAVRWRHGSVVCFVSVLGSHDIVFQDVFRLAQMEDNNITSG
jgi:hypothetical protein